ncbi:MAG: crosslink repair DNA glycosylase YcaQ family protein [Candidatus Promineifilaceae bacterium]
MSSPRLISATTARRMAITKQRLAGRRATADVAGIKDVLEDIRCLQIDPIRAVERPQYLILWSRLGNYDTDYLDRLVYEDRYLFEYWAHAASIVRTADYPIFKPQMEGYAAGNTAGARRTREWLMENKDLEAFVLAELDRNGPMSSDQFEHDLIESVEGGIWSSGRNVNWMLDLLWGKGKIMVAYRQGLKRYWDLAERCLPDWAETDARLDKEEKSYRAAQIALQALGVGRPRQIKIHFTRNAYANLQKVVKRLVKDGCFVPVQVSADGTEGETYWPGRWFVHVEDIPLLDRLEQGEWEPRTTLLSPFDNLICDRDRTEMMFDFFYRIEIYVPKAKRQYGYYVLPILHGDRMIGRISPKMNRKKDRLEVEAVYAEDDAPMTAEIGSAVRRAIEELAQFLGAKEISYGETLPTGWKLG